MGIKETLVYFVAAFASITMGCNQPCGDGEAGSSCSSREDCNGEMVCFKNPENDVGEEQACSGGCAIVFSEGCETHDDCDRESGQFCNDNRCLGLGEQ